MSLQTHEDMVSLIPEAKPEAIQITGHLAPLVMSDRKNELISDWLESTV